MSKCEKVVPVPAETSLLRAYALALQGNSPGLTLLAQRACPREESCVRLIQYYLMFWLRKLEMLQNQGCIYYNSMQPTI